MSKNPIRNTNKPPIIGIAGRARSGKDTVADFVLTELGGYRYSFADPLKAMLKPLGIDFADPYWTHRKEEVIPILGVSPRRLLQTLGTGWGREMIHPELWLILASQRLVRFGPGMIIADVRFENEAQWVRNNGGTIIHVQRHDAQEVAAHISERGIDLRLDVDKLLINDGTLEDLQHRVQEIVRGI